MKVLAFVLIAGLGAVTAAPVWSSDTGDKQVTTQNLHDSRLRFVRKLIEDSSAARRVRSSNNPEIIKLYKQSHEYYDEAARVHAAGNYEATDEALMQATETMFKAVRLAENRQEVADKVQQDLDRQMASVKALLDAHKRIVGEKGNDAANQELRDAAKINLKAAEQLRGQGDFKQARKYLHEAYVAVKLAVSELREGDTLVRSLNFATKEEEYRYELDRNDTHKILVKLLLKEKVQSEHSRNMVQSFVDKAAKLRVTAEAQAAQGDYETAVKTLEQSTRQLVRAIRGAGIFIPG